MSEELRTEELLTNEGHTETMADYEDHFDDAIHGTGFWNIWKRKRSSLLRSKES